MNRAVKIMLGILSRAVFWVGAVFKKSKCPAQIASLLIICHNPMGPYTLASYPILLLKTFIFKEARNLTMKFRL